MADTITFTLTNNQMTDVNVSVWDDLTTQQVITSVFVLQGNGINIQVAADSWGKGAAHWVFWSGDGSVNSNKQQTNISDGDQCTLG